jgi:hypothetical protein
MDFVLKQKDYNFDVLVVILKDLTVLGIPDAEIAG